MSATTSLDGYQTFLPESDVKLTISRYGKFVTYDAYITKGDSHLYARRVSKAIFDENTALEVSLGADHCVLTKIVANDPVSTIKGKLIGTFGDNQTEWGYDAYQNGTLIADNYQGFTIGVNSSVTFNFNQYSNMQGWDNGAILELLIDPVEGERWGWAGIRPDRWGWAGGDGNNISTITDPVEDYFTATSTSNEFFKNFPYCLNDAAVEMTIARNGNTLTITSQTTCKDGEVKTQVFTYTNDVFASDEYVVTCNLRAKYSHLDLLPYELNVSANDAGFMVL